MLNGRMDFLVFRSDVKVFRGEAVTDQTNQTGFGHRIGGPANWEGLDWLEDQPPIHALACLDLTDDRLGVNHKVFRDLGLTRLPLLCAIRYGACDLGYRVLSDNQVQILHQDDCHEMEDFPYENYPAELPARPLVIRELAYDPNQTEHATAFFGIYKDHLTEEQVAQVARHAVEEGFYDPEIHEEESVEEFLDNVGISWPFEQFRPDDSCPDPSCSNHEIRESLWPFAIFQEAPDSANKLWGKDHENLQIIFQICPKCAAILSNHQSL